MKVLLAVVLVCAIGAIAVSFFIDSEREAQLTPEELARNIDNQSERESQPQTRIEDTNSNVTPNNVTQSQQDPSQALASLPVVASLTDAEVSAINDVKETVSTQQKPLPKFSATSSDNVSASSVTLSQKSVIDLYADSNARSKDASTRPLEVIEDVDLTYKRNTVIVSQYPDIVMEPTAAGIPERLKTSELLDALAKSGVLIDGTNAQDITAQQLRESGLFGDPSQPGFQLQQQMIDRMEQGANFVDALTQVMNEAITPSRTILNDTAFNAVDNNFDLAVDFVQLMALTNDLGPVVIELMNLFPEFANENIGISVSLYPDYAQDVLNAAAQTAAIDPDSALLAALDAGADPSAVSAASAAGIAGPAGAGLIAPTASPLGAGIGAGGTGGGDTTASVN